MKDRGYCYVGLENLIFGLQNLSDYRTVAVDLNTLFTSPVRLDHTVSFEKVAFQLHSYSFIHHSYDVKNTQKKRYIRQVLIVFGSFLSTFPFVCPQPSGIH